MIKGLSYMTTRIYVSDVPELAQQWDWESNGCNTPEDTTAHSNKKVSWVCDKGHKWDAVVSSRTRGNGCPYCSGRKRIPGVNDFATLYPDIARQWNYKKNEGVDPTTLAPSSHKKVWWICDNGHEYQTKVDNRTVLNRGCPYCSGRYPSLHHNDLSTLSPHIAKQWDSKKNKDNNLEDVSIQSNIKAWWKCDKGHSWNAYVYSRARGSGCPYCAGRKVLSGFNDLATLYPDIAKQWDEKNNGDLTPSIISPGSEKKVWWICSKGHSYQASIDKRTRRKQGCNLCSNNVSLSEKEVADYVSSLLGEDAVETSNRSIISPYELDIYIPDKNVAIEFNGIYWHTENQGKDKRYHYIKWKMCKDRNIQLITIWEDEWKYKKDIVKSMLAHKLGMSQDRKVYARKTSPCYVDNMQAQKFFSSYHIQGYVSSTVHIGLKDDNENIVALSSWRKYKNTLYLDRYATSCVVAGGMGKLLKEGIKYAKNNGLDFLITFSDHQVSDGGLYEKLGFSRDKELYPDYRYVVEGKRVHKFNYRINRFKKDPHLIYKEGLTERELAEINGLERVWDCGKTRWVMEV